jgi:hypothetical protein
VLGAVAALIAASMLGVASAEAPTVTPTRTVNVEGVGTAPISLTATAAEANVVYRQAMGAAVTDGLSKAEVLAGKVGAALGGAQTVTEDGGDISCTSAGEYFEYQGEQADFGTARGVVTPLEAAASAPRSAVAKPTPLTRHRRHKRAKAASGISCKLEATLSISYAIG